MAKTPEGKVKDVVKALLQKAGAYYFMPVQTGFGSPTLDFLGVSHGRGFAIETKAPGKQPTPRQRLIASLIEAAGGRVFIIDGQRDQLRELASWLFQIPNRMD